MAEPVIVLCLGQDTISIRLLRETYIPWLVGPWLVGIRAERVRRNCLTMLIFVYAFKSILIFHSPHLCIFFVLTVRCIHYVHLYSIQILFPSSCPLCFGLESFFFHVSFVAIKY